MKKKLINNNSNIFIIIKYLFSSGSSFIIDLNVFTLFNFFIKNIFLSTIIARVISSLYNYLINSRIVFKSYTKNSIIKYYILVLVQMFISAYSVSVLTNTLEKINATIIKFFVDIIIFISNYVIQKEIVFNNKN